MEEVTRDFFEITRGFLEEDVECHFNWGLERLETGIPNILERFEGKLRDKDLIIETPLVNKWALKLSYGYEKFKIDATSGMQIVKDAVDDMESTTNSLFVRFKTAFRHVACSLLATMLFKTDQDTDQLHELILKITQYENMSNRQKSGVLSLKANALRWYGTGGTSAASQIITEASCMCPEEFEWKISRVITLTRMRHFNRSQSITWANVAVPMEILEGLVKSKDVVGDQEVVCKYFLAVTHRDLILMQVGDPEQKERSTAELKRLCIEMSKTKTTSPQVVSFVAAHFARNGQLDKGISMIERALEDFPRHIGLNTTICNLYKKSRNFDKVEHHSKIAMDEGGYGASWIYLEWAVKARVPIAYEDFFNSLLARHPSTYKAQTHVQAALFYYFHGRNVLRGSGHIHLALETDETYDGMKDAFCTWIRTRVNPLEIAYNQIHVYLRRRATFKARTILTEAEKKISSCADVTNYNTSKDLVDDLWRKFRQSCKDLHRKKSTSSSGETEEMAYNNGEAIGLL